MHPLINNLISQVPQRRYERKFLTDDRDGASLPGLLAAMPGLFREHYPPRWVNNIYFDTLNFENYYDHLHGAYRRCKVRLRWYGEGDDPLSPPVLEIKIREGMLGYKLLYPFKDSEAMGNSTGTPLSARLLRAAQSSDWPAPLAEYLAVLRPCSRNAYFRQYYQSCHGRVRLTVDSRLSYPRAGFSLDRGVRRDPRFPDAILEMKYAEPAAKEAQEVMSRLPFRLSRFSKYMAGMVLV